MAIFKIEVFKSFGGETWGNVYHVVAADLAEAVTAEPSIRDFEVGFHLSTVQITNARVSDLNPATDAFVLVPINTAGNRDIGAGIMLPLWDTLRLDLPVASGRPGRKYLRGMLLTSDLADDFGNLGSYLTTVESGLETQRAALASSTPLCQPDGDVITDVTGFLKVQMRQLHRKRRAAAP